jgi:hypothetical protein
MALRYKRTKAMDCRAEAGATVIQWVHALIGDHENTSVSLSSTECSHAGCGGEETVILFLRAHEPTIAIRISKPLEAVTEADVAEALQPILVPARVIDVA